ncbi:MAG: hypothetical protein R6U52_01425 [Kosmotogaceae bacterium]
MKLGGFLILAVILFVVVCMFTGQAFYEQNKDNETFGIYNFTGALNWNYTLSEKAMTELQNQTVLNFANNSQDRVTNIIHKTVDWLGYTMFEIAKWGIEFGYTHPENDYKSIIHFIRISIYIIIAFLAIPAIAPICALAYLSYAGARKASQWIASKKAKLKNNHKTKKS